MSKIPKYSSFHLVNVVHMGAILGGYFGEVRSNVQAGEGRPRTLQPSARRSRVAVHRRYLYVVSR